MDIAGAPYQFANPYTITFMATEQTPAQYEVEVPADDSAVIWSSSMPPFSTLDFIALQADAAVTLAVQVDGGTSADFTIHLRGGGFPLVLHGLPSGSEITQITATNANTTDPAFVSVLVAQEEV